MKVSITALMLAGLLFTQAICFSKVPDPNLTQKLSESKGVTSLYIENKGQIGDQHGKPNNEVKYLILRPGLNIQLKANSFSYDTYTVERFKRVEPLEGPFPSKLDKLNNDSLVYHFSRVDIELVDANPNPEITQEGASSDYLNYYTHITSQTQGESGVTGVRGYSNIVYHDIYPNIDLEWFLDKDGKPEYQFIINPGGDPSRIRLKYHGAQKTELISDAIHIHIKPGIIKEHIPLSYLKESKEKLQIAFSRVADNEYGFNIPTYACNETLIIDPMPNRLWGTYYGGDNNVYMNKIAVDNGGDIFVAGGTVSSTSIATTGTHQVNHAGNWDAFVVKFNSSGVRIWGTYYGGSNIDDASSLILDVNQNVYCSGKSFSASGISTSGAHQVNFGGGPSDGMIFKLNSTGIRDWGTYYGGNSEDACSDIGIDAQNDIYIVGISKSQNAISTTGTHQQNHSGIWDAFLVKMTNSGTRLWSTYYGGTQSEEIARISVRQNSIVCAGTTLSDNNISTSGSYQQNRKGYYEGYVAKFTSSGSLIWGTYYGGTSRENIEGVSQASDGSIYIAGSTESSTSISTIGTYQSVYGGGSVYGDAFIAKFSSSGSLLWGTYYGGSDDEFGHAVHCDDNGNAYLIGQTSSISGISSTDAFQIGYGNNKDVFFAKINSSGQRIWGSYYGGADDDDGSHIQINNGNVYVCGITWSSGIYGTSGTHQQHISGLYIYNGFVTKFQDSGNPIPHSITVSIGVLSFCEIRNPIVNYTATGTYNSPNVFSVQLSDANGSFANPTVIGSISSILSGTIQCQIPSNISLGSGYRIRVVSSNPVIIGNDNGSNISINASPKPIISGLNNTCNGQGLVSYSVQETQGHTYVWSQPQKGVIVGAPSSSVVNIRWLSIGIDTVKVRQTNPATSCTKDTFIVVIINETPKPVISGVNSTCMGSTAVSYSLPTLSGHAYQWFKPTKGSIIGSSTESSINVNWNQSGIDSIRVRLTNTQTGCFKDTLLYVTIQPLPLPVIHGPKVLCKGEINQTYTVASVSGHAYEWSSVKHGKIKGPKTGNTLIIDWVDIGIDTLKIRQTNSQTGCIKDTSFIITIHPKPEAVVSGNPTVCLSSPLQTYSVKVRNGYSYFWYPPLLGDIMGAQTEDVVNIRWGKIGIDTLMVSIKDLSTGCTNDTFIIVSVANTIKPAITAFGNQNFLCKGDSRGLECITNAQSYQWKKNGIDINGANEQTYIAFESGEYSVSARLGLCDGESEKITLVEYELPNPSIIGPKEVIASDKVYEYEVSNIGMKSSVWSSSSNAIIREGKENNKVAVQFSVPGEAFLIVKQQSELGCIGQDSLSVVVKSVSNIYTDDHIFGEAKIFPNPIARSENLIVQISDKIFRDVKVDVSDILGIVHYSTIWPVSSTNCLISTSNLPSGLYVIRIHTKGKTISKTVIVN